MTDSTGPSGVPRQRISSGVLPLFARIAISLIFIQAVLGKVFGWSGQAAYMAQHGISPVAPLLGSALAIELIGVVCLLIGYRARLAALVMALYLCILSVMLHNFWSHSAGQSEMASMIARTEFMKNMGIMGGLLMIVAHGPGRFSLQQFLRRRSENVSY
jgi:putative oxidoreductase